MGFLDLFGRHLLFHFLLRDRSVGVPPDRREDVPHIGADKVGRGHAATNLVVPAHARLRPRVALHRCAQIPFEGASIVALDTESQSVHHTDQLFGFSVARSRRWQKLFHRSGIILGIHQIARRFNLGHRRRCQQQQGKGWKSHIVSVLIALAGAPAYGNPLPEPLQPSDFIAFDPAQAKIGQLLFFDPILSGNRNIACATCHHPDHGTGDGLSLGIGEGGVGLGPDRTPGQGDSRIIKRIPRNAPALWNLGAKEIEILFHDGRVSVSDIYDNGFDTPAQEWLPDGLNSILAVQALFPLTSQFEMAGDPKENQVAGAAYDRIDAVWPILAKRVRIIPEYAEMFIEAFDDVDQALDINITHIANALAAFEATEFQSYDSPFDAYLNGDDRAMTEIQKHGMEVFFSKANCSGCHSGPLFSDQEFHALMLPHFGPGRTRQWDPIVRDVGRMGASDRLEDAYRFRTPSLRNVTLSAPYGHNGAFATLGAMIRHHINPKESFTRWQPVMADLPEVPWLASIDFLPLQDKRERTRLGSQLDIQPVALLKSEIAALEAFLHALTGTQSIEGRLGRPDRVPSGLEVPK